MLLKDFVLSYEVNGKIKADLFEYYDRYIKTLDKRFENYSYNSGDLVLCFFRDHNDINPSMGWMHDKNHKGGKVCHCFGCGRTADIIRIHQILRSTYEGIELTEKESCIEIANMFEIPIDEFDEVDDEDYEAKYLATLKKIKRLSNRYTIRDYSSDILKIRKEANGSPVDLNVVNSAYVKMTATVKQLYS